MPAGFDDVFRDADGAPDLVLVPGVDQHPHPGGRAAAAVDHAHLEVHQPHGVEVREEAPQGLAQCVVQGADRTVALGRRDLVLAAHRDLDRGVGLAGLALVFFDGDAEGLKLEKRREGLGQLLQEDLEGAVRHIELVAVLLELFDLGHDAAAVDPLLVELDAELARLVRHVAAAGQVGDEHAALVADPLRVHVLVGLGHLHDGAHVHAALVGKGAAADEGPVVHRHDVGGFVHETRQRFELLEVLRRNADPVHLQAQDGDHGGEVGVAAALAKAVDRSVHHDRTRAHGRNGIGQGQPAVVVGVDAEPHPGEARAHLGEYGLDVAGQAAAVGVAQHDEVGAALGGGRDGLKRVVAVVLEAVEEVLRVVDRFAAVPPQAGNRVPDHGQVLLQPVFHHLGDVQVPALAEDGHDPGPAVDERLQLLVRVGRDSGAAGAAERRQPGVFESRRFRQLEKTQVLGVRAGPSAFNVVDADVVQAQGDLELFLGAEGDVLALGAVPECRVVNEDRFHRCLHRGGKPRTVIFGFRA